MQTFIVIKSKSLADSVVSEKDKSYAIQRLYELFGGGYESFMLLINSLTLIFLLQQMREI